MGDATRSVVVEKEYRHRPEKVWRALTEGALIKLWLMPNDFEPVMGRRFAFRMPAMPQWDGVVHGEVLVAEPYVRLAYTWATTAGLETVVEFTLMPTEVGTMVRMEQSGFRAEQEQNYKGAGYGWKSFLGKMESLLDAIETMPHAGEGETR